jgi:hypothetical protein
MTGEEARALLNKLTMVDLIKLVALKATREPMSMTYEWPTCRIRVEMLKPKKKRVTKP